MRFRFSYVLYLLLLAFALMYFYGTYVESFPAKDLWGNLLASVIAVLLIDRIVLKTELQKSERSMRYIKGRIRNTLTDLARRLVPPVDWQKRLSAATPDFDDYVERVLATREQALSELNDISDRYLTLIETELRNDVFDIMDLLNNPTWPALQESTRYPEDDSWNLRNYMTLVSAIISKSVEIIRHHKLLQHSAVSIGPAGKGESSTYRYLELPERILEHRYAAYEKYLREATALRDCSDAKLREQTAKKKKRGQP